MKPKNKFLCFLFSIIPGVGHFYLGLMKRGLVFFLGFCGMILLNGFFTGAFSYHLFKSGFMVLGYQRALHTAMTVLWIYCLVDCFNQYEKLRRRAFVTIEAVQEIEDSLAEDNLKLTSIILSIVPGLGHLFLGRKERGLQLLLGFGASLLLYELLGFAVFQVVIMVLLVLSIIDLIKNFNNTAPFNGGDTGISALKKYFSLSYVGIGLIVIGAFILLRKVAYDFVDYSLVKHIEEYIGILIASFLCIFAGIKIIMKSAKKN